MGCIDILGIERGLIVAPAGCGKTHLITEALRSNKAEKPILVLTHTNAGVAALRGRLSRLQIQRRSYHLVTIDGWALRLASAFPLRSGYSGGTNPRQLDYPMIRKAALRLLDKDHITDILKASYSRILVDEYQDCSLHQHKIIFCASRHLPTCVLGDPMQAIFGFRDDKLANWDDEICKDFPLVNNLDIPWRWRNAGSEELGAWLLEKREALLAGQAIDINKSPKSVKWIKLNGDREDHKKLMSAVRYGYKQGETLLVVGSSFSAKSRHNIAKNIPGIITVESVDLEDLANYARKIDLKNSSVVCETLEFAQSLMTKVEVKKILARLKSLEAGTANKSATDAEAAALSLKENPSFQGVAALLQECSRQSGSRTYRSEVLRSAMDALSICRANSSVNFEEAIARVREENRALGRKLPRKAIGSTLLLKGLEADHVIVLNADQLNIQNLYVAMTRGAKFVTLCSTTNILPAC